MGRPRMPEWFTRKDSEFFKKHITPERWAGILEDYNHQVLREECEEHGVPIESVRFYWHKSKRISLFSKTDSEGLNKQEIFSRLFEAMGDYTMPTFEFPEQDYQPNCAIINLYDAHLDKIALKSETGKDNSIEENIARYHAGFDKLLSSVLEHRPETIIYPIGNDFFHANDFTGRTKKGTPIQYLASPEEAYALVCQVAIDCLAKLAQTGAKIIVPFVKGNHDEDNVTILGFWLKQLFAEAKNVKFLPGRRQRNYYRYGKNMFGFAHGDKEKSRIAQLPLLMAQEQPAMWAATLNRKFFCGDLHHEFEYKFLQSKDRPGVQVAFLRSVGGSDKYHVDHGWIGIPKTAYAEIWQKDRGEVAGFRVNL